MSVADTRSYVPDLSGMLVAHSGAEFLRSDGLIDGDSAFSDALVGFDATVWRPQLGMRLGACQGRGAADIAEGRIVLSSPSHVSLLLYGTFNAAITAAHLPTSKWEFVHDSDEAPPRKKAHDRSVGFWRHKNTGKRLGGDNEHLTFTVISMTIANHMLSLHGR